MNSKFYTRRLPQWTTRHLLLVTVSILLVAANDMLPQENHVDMPVFQQHNNILRFYVPENAPNNTFVGVIKSSSNQVPEYVVPNKKSSDPNAGYTPENIFNEAFSFNMKTGDIYTKMPLDRERREYYYFAAIVNHPFTDIKCSIKVMDVNDNAPMFLMPNQNETHFVIDIPEGQRGIRKSLPLAVDLDSEPFGIQEFRLRGSPSDNMISELFKLVQHDAPARSTLPNGLGADDATNSMTMTAGENPQLQRQFDEQAAVLIPSRTDIQSANTKSQNFALGLVVSPSTPGASMMTNVQPIINMPQTANSAPSLVSKHLIDLELLQPLDRENQSTYQLLVEAIDHGPIPLIGKLMVTINVLDVNDNDPVFRQSRYECQSREDTPKGTLLIRVQAFDVDLDSNGQISYFIKRHSSSSQTYPINNNSSDNSEVASTGRFSGKPRQQAQQPALTATISASSNGKLMQRGGQPLNSGNEFYENQESSDDYKSKFAGNPPEQLFEIDPMKGEIYLARMLDFETDQSHELVIEARDHGKPSRSAYTIVKVFVIDINDDPPSSTAGQLINEKNKQSPQVPSSEASKSENTNGRFPNEMLENSQDFLKNVNIISYFSGMNSTALFVVILMALLAMALPFCLVKIKSNGQPELDYNDTDGLNPNKIKTKQSPNHSTSNEHSIGSNDGHHRHHDNQRRANGFAVMNGTGSSFDSPNCKRYQYIDSSNHYHNPYPPQPVRHPSGHLPQADSPVDHQMAGGLGSVGGTMTLHGHRALLGSAGGHHSLEHQFPSSGQGHHTSSLTYAHHHSRAALLHQAHHHQSSHHLSSMHHVGGGHHNKGGTMNSIGTHHSAHPSASPLPATPNTTHTHLVQQTTQLPHTPCNVATSSMSPWPQAPGSTLGCLSRSNGDLHCNLPSIMDNCSSATNSQQPLDRWSDLGIPTQLVYTQDLSSYNWEYLADWAPEYNNLMQLIEADASNH